MNKAFLQKVMNRILTLFISLTGAFTLVFFMRGALPDGFVKPLGLTLILITVLDILSLLAHDLFVSEKANGFAYVRYAVYLNIILVLIIKFCKPIVSTGLIWLGTNFAVVLTYLIKRMFDFYEIFTAHTTGLSGKHLSSDLTENNWFVSDYINCAKKLIWSLFIISIVLSSMVLTLHIIKDNVGPQLYLSLGCFIAGFTGLIIVHKANDHETSFAFLGHNEIFSFRKRILIICMTLCLISVGGGAILSSDTAILKPSYFAWILKMFSLENAPADYVSYASESGGDDSMTFDLDDDFYAEKEQSLLSKFLHDFFIALEYIFVAALICGIAAFLFSAFFGKKWKEFWKNKKLSAFLRQVWVRLKQLVYDLMHMKRQKRVFNTAEAASFKATMKSLLSGAHKSKEKRAELDALTKKFMQLVDYAVAEGISYKPHMAPLEFCALLAARLSAPAADKAAPLSGAPSADKAPAASKADSALTAGRLFEQALYAKELLTKEESTLFTESIAAIVK